MTFSCRFRRTEWILGLILLIACIEMVVYTVFGTARPQSPRCNVPIGCSPCLKPVKLELTDNSKPSRGQGEQP